MASNDPFDDVLHLEDRFYSEGYEQGVADGDRAGRVEGRSFGIEKGFEKFVEAGRLYGRSVVWANRLQQSQPAEGGKSPLPGLRGGGARLEKNVVTLHALVEPDTMSTENSDEAVNDFDDRVKRAQGKARVIERQVGEEGGANPAKGEGSPRANGARSGGGGDKPSGSTASASAGPRIDF